ncbi:alpha/beta hydrolase [Paraburkholderia bonniea]|uniref:alpha/beta hydrolase n=1 Tax=Paraburkholderia bonniea TaxID=2152891 RepID=UPI001FE9A788|nr:alpha/beta hydrolase [Paraburkholderia bonniea]WJF92105.1 alpha/beta hydrolase [Paraburkholderia bonniea]WJF95425.1 alpha/beta hydrolase [Paraburkholderia bonniea]
MSASMSAAPALQLVAIDVRPGATMESQSGLQNLRPRIYGALATPAADNHAVAAIVMHPTSNFMGHYLLQPLAERGIACLGLNSRYAGNDAMLLMEQVIQDLGAGVKWLRAQGYRKVVLIGNSGGAALCSFYQAEAEHLSATHYADGLPTHLVPQDLPPADALILSAAHAGRARLIEQWLDPSVIEEDDPLATDPQWDLYCGLPTPFSATFVDSFRAAQRARRERIEQWVLQRLRLLRALPDGPQDQTFLVYRTHADPRFLDLSLDANDRAPGSIWGDPRTVNYAANAMGRFNTLRSWLSQWSSRSLADGPKNLARTSVPVLLMTHTADGSTFPSTAQAWREAAPGRLSEVEVKGGNHYLSGQPELVRLSADAFHDWLGRHLA